MIFIFMWINHSSCGWSIQHFEMWATKNLSGVFPVFIEQHTSIHIASKSTAEKSPGSLKFESTPRNKKPWPGTNIDPVGWPIIVALCTILSTGGREDFLHQHKVEAMLWVEYWCWRLNVCTGAGLLLSHGLRPLVLCPCFHLSSRRNI